jgi:hypothetical protein
MVPLDRNDPLNAMNRRISPWCSTKTERQIRGVPEEPDAGCRTSATRLGFSA